MPFDSRARTDAPTIVLHWLLVLTLILSLGTGLRIAADAEDATLSRWLAPILIQGEISDLHVIAATFLTFIALTYAVYLRRTRLAARVSFSLNAIKTGTRLTRWYAVNKALYWVAFGLLLLAGITGALLYFAPGLLPARLVITAHLAAAWMLILYVVLHVAAQLALGGLRQLLKIFSPRLAYGAAAGVAAAFSLVAVAAVAYPTNEAVVRPLKFARTAVGPQIDGDPNDDAWAQAEPAQVHTMQGANLPGGAVTVRVRALHDGENAYLLFEWPDATRSQKHLPLLKTAEGWTVMEREYGIQDEDHFYEDKFAVMLARSSRIGGGATQMGPKPLDDKPGPAGGRGLHYTTDASYVDVWHWKSVRTGPLGQVDDNHFGPPLPAPEKAGTRYTGGYTQDPKTAGGYDQNWVKAEGAKGVTPKRLPKDLGAIQARLGNVNLDPHTSDDGEWWMSLAETVPYTTELDHYPVGTVIPSVLIDRPFEGDRGDVRAVATWRNGWWRLETARKLAAESKFDVPIAKGTYLWVSVFDHTQTRHSRHLHPLRIELR